MTKRRKIVIIISILLVIAHVILIVYCVDETQRIEKETQESLNSLTENFPRESGICYEDSFVFFDNIRLDHEQVKFVGVVCAEGDDLFLYRHEGKETIIYKTHSQNPVTDEEIIHTYESRLTPQIARDAECFYYYVKKDDKTYSYKFADQTLTSTPGKTLFDEKTNSSPYEYSASYAAFDSVRPTEIVITEKTTGKIKTLTKTECEDRLYSFDVINKSFETKHLLVRKVEFIGKNIYIQFAKGNFILTFKYDFEADEFFYVDWVLLIDTAESYSTYFPSKYYE